MLPVEASSRPFGLLFTGNLAHFFSTAARTRIPKLRLVAVSLQVRLASETSSNKIFLRSSYSMGCVALLQSPGYQPMPLGPCAPKKGPPPPGFISRAAEGPHTKTEACPVPYYYLSPSPFQASKRAIWADLSFGLRSLSTSRKSSRVISS